MISTEYFRHSRAAPLHSVPPESRSPVALAVALRDMFLLRWLGWRVMVMTGGLWHLVLAHCNLISCYRWGMRHTHIYIFGGFPKSWGYPSHHPVVMDDHDLEDRFTQSVTLGDLPGSKELQDFWEFTNLVVANKEPSFLVTLKCRPSVLNELYCLAVKKRCPQYTSKLGSHISRTEPPS
jgi:hypothetical protein